MTFVVAAILTLFASFTLEAAHAAQAAPIESHAVSVVTVDHEGGAQKSKQLHSGHCSTHCASHVMADPSPASEALPALHARTAWLPSPSERRSGTAPNPHDQPPRG